MAKNEVIEQLKKIELQLSQTREFHSEDTSPGYWETLTRVDVALNELLDLKIQLVDALKETYRA